MAEPSATYRVNVWKLEQLLAALREEYEKAKLTRSQRIAFVLLQIAVYAVPLWLLTAVLLADEALWDGGGEETLSFLSCAFVALAVASLVVLLPFNLPLVRSVVRQVRLDRKLGRLLPAERGSHPLTTRTPRQDLWLKLLAGALVLLAALVVLLALKVGYHPIRMAVAVPVLAAGAWLLWSKRQVPIRVVRIGFWLILGLSVVAVAVSIGVFGMAVLGGFGAAEDLWLMVAFVGVPLLLVLLLPALVLASNRYLSWLRGRMHLLDDVDRLRTSLERQREEAHETGELVVDLSQAQAKRLSEVEEVYIRQRRAAAIGEARGRERVSYTIFKTQSSRAQLEALEPRLRLLAESAIEELSVDPHPDGASPGPDGGRLRLAVPGTGAEIVYEVDDGRRQVQVLSVLPPTGGTDSEGDAPGRSADG